MASNFDEHRFGGHPRRPDPGNDGRDDLSESVLVYAHHSSYHDGLNVEIDAPAGVRVTVHLNDGLMESSDMVVPE